MALGVSRRWTLGALLALVTMGCELPHAAPAAPARAQVAQAAPTREANPAPPTPAAVPTPATDDAGQWGNAGGLRYLELVRGGASLDDTLPRPLASATRGRRRSRSVLSLAHAQDGSSHALPSARSARLP